MNVDFHVHTNRSPDGVHRPRDMVKSAKRAGLDAIAITDHNRVFPWNEARDLSREFGIVVIPGLEGGNIIREKHWISLGIREYPAGIEIFSILERIRNFGGLTVAPHPYTRLGYGNYADLGFEVVEALNGTDPESNRRVRYCPSIPEVAGSDAHSAPMLGFCWTSVDASETIESILEAVRKGLCIPQGTETPFSRSFFLYWEYFASRIFIDPVHFVRSLPEFFQAPSVRPHGNAAQSGKPDPGKAGCKTDRNPCLFQPENR